jgi:mRNA interferase RelE/StbE
LTSYKVRVHPGVKKDISRLAPPVWKRIKKQINHRLTAKPEYFGSPLRGTLKGLWKFRVGDYRVVYKIDEQQKQISLLLIAHRKDAYSKVTRRLQ